MFMNYNQLHFLRMKNVALLLSLSAVLFNCGQNTSGRPSKSSKKTTAPKSSENFNGPSEADRSQKSTKTKTPSVLNQSPEDSSPSDPQIVVATPLPPTSSPVVPKPTFTIIPPKPITTTPAVSTAVAHPIDLKILLKCNESPLKTIESYSLKPSIDRLSQLIQCGVDDEKTSPIESLVVLNLARRLIALSPDSTMKNSLLFKVTEILKQKSAAQPNLSESILTFKKREQVAKTFNELVERKTVTNPPLSSANFPAWKFEWKDDLKILELQTWDQYYYKVLAEWSSARILKMNRSPQDFNTISKVTLNEVNYLRNLIQTGLPSQTAELNIRPTELDKKLQPVVPIRLMSEPVYFKIEKDSPSIQNDFSSEKFNSIIMDLSLVNKFEELKKELKETYGVTGITTFGTYNHRYINGSKNFSNHAYGTAIDISGFQWSDGKKASILLTYKKSGNKELRNRMEKIRAFFTKKFDTVLGPGQKDHADHFHLDLDPKKKPMQYSKSSSYLSLLLINPWVSFQKLYYKMGEAWNESATHFWESNEKREPEILSGIVFHQDSHESSCTD